MIPLAVTCYGRMKKSENIHAWLTFQLYSHAPLTLIYYFECYKILVVNIYVPF